MNEEVRNKINNYQPSAPKQAWDNISKASQAHKSVNWWQMGSITGIVILAVAVGIIYFAPSKEEIANETVSITREQKQLAKTSENLQTEHLSSNQQNINNPKPKGVDASISTSFTISEPKSTQIAPPFAQKPSNTLIIPEENLVVSSTPFITSLQSVTTPELLAQSDSKKTKISQPSTEDTIGSRRNLFMPNAFTPTKNTNNSIKPIKTRLLTYELTIYNRNGLQLFHTTNIDEGWNGYYKGKLCAMGAYVYVIKFENIEHYNHTQTGTINLIR